MDMEEHEEQWMDTCGALTMATLGIQQGDTVVDFGCGVGRYSIPLSKVVEKNGTVYAIERDEENLAELRKRARRFNAPESLTTVLSNDLQLKPIPSGSVDFLFAFDVLQYVDDWPLFCAMADRILKPTGIVHIYPAEIPHPGAIDTARLTKVFKPLHFEQAQSDKYDMMHDKFRIRDRIYSFRRTK